MSFLELKLLLRREGRFGIGSKWNGLLPCGEKTPPDETSANEDCLSIDCSVESAGSSNFFDRE